MSRQFTSAPFRMLEAILAARFCHAGIVASCGKKSGFCQERSRNSSDMSEHLAALDAAVQAAEQEVG